MDQRKFNLIATLVGLAWVIVAGLGTIAASWGGAPPDVYWVGILAIVVPLIPYAFLVTLVGRGLRKA